MDGIELNLPNELETYSLHPHNVTYFLSSSVDSEVSAELDPDYEQFLADVWIGVVLTLMVLSCVCCMCSCLLYHKFQQWKRHIIDSRNPADLESGATEAELPSYTIASGLPSYEEALEHLKQVKEQCAKGSTALVLQTAPTGPNQQSEWVPHTPPTPLSTLSVAQLFPMYRKADSRITKPT